MRRRFRTPLQGPWGVLLAAGMVLPPLLWLGAAAVRAALAPGPFLPDRIALHLLQQSLFLAALAAGIALGLGLPYGWLAARWRLPGRRFLIPASVLPVLLPPYAGALAWSLLLAREGTLNHLLVRWGWIQSPISPSRSLPLAALVLGFTYWPVPAWFTLFAARSVPGDLEDAARFHLPDAAAARWSAWPAIRRSLPVAVLLVFLLALADFGVPNALGLPTYPVEIVNRFQIDRNPGIVARLALPLLAIVTPLVLAQSRAYASVSVASRGSAPRLLGGWPAGIAGAGWCLLVLGVSSLLPLGMLAASSLPLRTYPAVWAESWDHFLNTLFSAGGGALLAVAVALGYGWTTRGRSLPGLDLFLTLPYALPGSLIGVAMIQILNRPGLAGELYTSLGGLIWTYAAFFYPFACKTLQPAWGHVDESLLEEGEILGAGQWVRFRTTAWPALRAHAVAGGAMVALLAAREMDATALLRIPGGDTIAFRIHDYLHFAPGPNVAALCVMLVLCSAAAAGALAAWAWNWKN